MASLAENYCSLNTRDLRGGTRGKGVWLRNSNESSRSLLLFSKRSIHYIDVFISLLQVIMMKSSSFLRKFHRTYERTRGNFGRTDLTRLTIWQITSGKVAESNSRIETLRKYREQSKEVSWEVSSGQAIVRCLIRNVKGGPEQWE